MASLQTIKQIADRLNSSAVFQTTRAQSNARYILYGVHEDTANFPRFNLDLNIKAGQIAFLCFEIACTYSENNEHGKAVDYFEQGATLLEHCYFRNDNQETGSDYYVLAAALAYYCSCQYSKAYILLTNTAYDTVTSKLIKSFLTKQTDQLEELIKSVMLAESGTDQDYVYNNILSRAFSLILLFNREGDKQNLLLAEELLDEGCKFTLLSDEPGVWWVFRLLKIICHSCQESSLWYQLHGNDGFKRNIGEWADYAEVLGLKHEAANDEVDKYIYSLAFREKAPVFELFVSQRRALAKILNEEGSVISMPTSSGKTRIAEITILQLLITDSDSKVLYIAPFRSLSFEMEDSLSSVFGPIGYGVTHLYGGTQFTSVDRSEIDNSRIIIATPEKAKAILRVNDEAINAIKLVVMDEGHLLGTGEREIANEMFTEELRRIVRHNGGKFLVLSAVLPNANDISVWLAKSTDNVVESSWRPSTQRLGKIVYIRNRIDLQWLDSDYPCFNSGFIKENGDKKELVAKTAIKLSSMGSILIYCPQKNSVMSNARIMYSLLQDSPDIDWGDDFDWNCFELICNEVLSGQELLKLARKGILCHSANLEKDVRRYMEKLLRKGKAKYIYATNTLAQGVNLGVSTVIVMGVNQGGKGSYINKRDFWNMAGRAGRSFIDTEGKILYVVDGDAKEYMVKWRHDQADDYLLHQTLDDAESGVCKLLKALCKIPLCIDISFEDFIQILTEDAIEEKLPSDYKDVNDYLELVDDSLLALDIAYRDNDRDDIKWVEEHFRDSLALLQEKDEEQREKYVKILKARVKAVRTMTKDKNVPQSFASSGIPIKAALYLNEKLDEIRALAVEFFASKQDTADIEYLLYQLDRIIQEIPSSRIQKYDIDILDKIRNPWVEGLVLPTDVKGTEDISQYYYNYTASWIFNSLAAIFATQEEDEIKTLFEELSLIVSNGLPSKWAVKIYQSGISSRLSATELSNIIEEPYDMRASEVAEYIRDLANEEALLGKLSDRARQWVSLLLSCRRERISKRIKFPSFHFSNNTHQELNIPLYCKSYEGSTYLCTSDYQTTIKVKDTERLKFSEIADIPGVSFIKERNKWVMRNVNPYIEIV